MKQTCAEKRGFLLLFYCQKVVKNQDLFYSAEQATNKIRFRSLERPRLKGQTSAGDDLKSCTTQEKIIYIQDFGIRP